MLEQGLAFSRAVRVLASTALLAAAALVLAACTGGTDTGNPLTDLDIGGCKSEGPDYEPLAVRALALTKDAARYDGIECYLAERKGESVALEAINFAGGCHVAWDAHGRERDGRVDVVLTNPSCAVAGCGLCLYDASFTVDLPAEGSEIELIDQPCEGEPEVIGSWKVPAADGDTTLSCSFQMRGVSDHAGRLGLCGKENMPCAGSRACGGSAGSETAGTCDEGLTCTPLSEYDSRCLKECTSDDECAVPGAMRCIDGLCGF